MSVGTSGSEGGAERTRRAKRAEKKALPHERRIEMMADLVGRIEASTRRSKALKQKAIGAMAELAAQRS